jgi:cation:H+ antiporter
MIYLFTRKSEFHEKFKADKRHSILITLFLFAAVLGILFLSSHFVVFFATQLAIELALPQIFIGLFLIALGTSLPELVFEIKSVLAKKGDLAIGDAMGSVVCNSTLVLGVTALISPIIEASSIFFISSVFMLFVILLFAIMIRSKKGLTIAGSLLLVFAYILFIIFEFYLK